MRDVRTAPTARTAYVVWVGLDSTLQGLRERVAAEIRVSVGSVDVLYRFRLITSDSASLKTLVLVDGCTVTATRRDEEETVEREVSIGGYGAPRPPRARSPHQRALDD